jgi:hypothetical protein
MKQGFESKLSHSRSAYLFSVNSLPDPDPDQKLPFTLNGFVFDKKSQINSMIIELGWAFFCRYEGCLEAHIKTSGLKFNKNYNVKNWMDENSIQIPSHFTGGLEVYRNIRNKLHHEDGAGCDDTEIHLLPEHMENFYNLFIWIGKEIERVTSN